MARLFTDIISLISGQANAIAIMVLYGILLQPISFMQWIALSYNGGPRYNVTQLFYFGVK